MPKAIDMKKFATKKELEKYKREVERMVKQATKGIKKWDVKQDKKLMKRAKK